MFTTNPVNSQPLQKCENSSAKVDDNGNPQMPQNYASSPFLADLDNFGNSSYQQKHKIDNRCKSSMDVSTAKNINFTIFLIYFTVQT